MRPPHIGHSRAAFQAGPALGLSSGGRPTPHPLSGPFPVLAQRPPSPITALPSMPQRDAGEPLSPQFRFLALAMNTLRAEQNPLKTGLSQAL